MYEPTLVLWSDWLVVDGSFKNAKQEYEININDVYPIRMSSNFRTRPLIEPPLFLPTYVMSQFIMDLSSNTPVTYIYGLHDIQTPNVKWGVEPIFL